MHFQYVALENEYIYLSTSQMDKILVTSLEMIRSNPHSRWNFHSVPVTTANRDTGQVKIYLQIITVARIYGLAFASLLLKILAAQVHLRITKFWSNVCTLSWFLFLATSKICSMQHHKNSVEIFSYMKYK